MTGVPVTPVDEHRPLTEVGEESGRPLDGDAQEYVIDLLGFVESATATTERADDRETIALRADVLFDFDDATLGSEASDVLGETAAAIQANGAAGTAINVVARGSPREVSTIVVTFDHEGWDA
jgi:OmpA-OmpF porin, OOP family